MATYTKTTNFTAKDNLTSGDPAKVIKGSEFDTEFNALETAVNSKANANNGTHTGTTTVDTANIDTLQIDGTTVTATAAELNTLDGITASTAELNITDGLTATTAELNTLDGITSTTAELNKLDGFTGTAADLNYAKDLRATGVTTTEFDKLDGLTATTSELNILDGATVTTSELNILDGVTATASEINTLDGITATTTELNYTDGVTSNIQTQLDGKATTAQGALADSAVQPNDNVTFGTGDFTGDVDVTGTVTADGLTVEGSTGIIVRNDAVGANEPKVVFDNDTFAGANHAQIQTGNGGLQLLLESPSTSTFQNRHQILMNGGGGDDVTFKLSTDNGSTYKNQLKIDNNDFHLYEDTGTTAKFHWDSSAESLGIGVSPSNKLHINADGAGSAIARMTNTNGAGYGLLIDSTDSNNARYGLRVNSGAGTALYVGNGGNVGIGTSSPSRKVHASVGSASEDGFRFSNTAGTAQLLVNTSGDTRLVNSAGKNTIFDTAGTERMRIDSSGNVGIGTSSHNSDLTIYKTDAEVTIANASGTTGSTSSLLFSNGSTIEAKAGLFFEDKLSNNRGNLHLAVNGNTLGDPVSKDDAVMTLTSSGNVGIGTSSPSAKLDVLVGANQRLLINTLSDDVFLGAVNGANTGYQELFINGSTLKMGTNGSERARLDSSGNLLVGTTSATPYDFASGTGARLSGGLLAIASVSDNAAAFNRTSTDGSIVQFRKDGQPVGSIGNDYGSEFYVGGTQSSGLYFSSTAIRPTSGGDATTLIDDTIVLGSAAHRYKDLYLSGGVYLGGTGSANKLDDYEEGNWTPLWNGGTLTNVIGKYTKIGDMVYLSGEANFNAPSNAIQLQISGLPFTPKAESAVGTILLNAININDATKSLSTYVHTNSYIRFFQIQDSLSWAEMENDQISSGDDFIFSMCYRTNA